MGDNTLPAQMAPVTNSLRDEMVAAAAVGPTDQRLPPAAIDHIDVSDKIGSKVKTRVKVTGEGTLDIDVDDSAAQLSAVLKPVVDHHVGRRTAPKYGSRFIPASFTASPTSMNIVIHIVGTRGDVQPFISLGIVLKQTYKHRVRVATHLIFKKFVEDNGLEFFNIGGDPETLIAFMVAHPSLLPDLHTLASGEIGKRRKGISEILDGCWRSCIEPGDGTGEVPDINRYPYQYYKVDPFIADAIIANPPSFAHVHCAEKLGIPLHMMFTMPWSPTQSFPHPLVNIRSTNANPDMTNYISYTLVDMMTWQGLGDVINKFRVRTLNLEPVSVMWAPGMTHRLRIPFTYCWSPALIPKPKDWAEHISISGFYFLSLASSYTPDKALLDFLAAGPPPVYIGFGSIVVDDPDAMTRLIFKAVELAGIRALVSQGWGGLGAHELGRPDEVFMLGNVPHDWLFQHVSAVVHHGGAGTTAAGILAGRPSVVVPFFGDQPFWGSMIARAGAGPEPIPYKKLTAESLAAQLRVALAPETLVKAKELGKKMAAERGAELGAKYFHKELDPNMQCSILPGRVAVWRLKKTNVLLSAKATAVLCAKAEIQEGDFKLHRPMEYETKDGPWDPVSGVASVLVGTLSTLAVGAADIPSEVFHTLKTRIPHRNSTTSEASSKESLESSRPSSVSSTEDEKQENKPLGADAHANADVKAQVPIERQPLISIIQRDPTVESLVPSVDPKSVLDYIAKKHPHLSPETIARLTAHSDSHEKNAMEERKQSAKDGVVRAAKIGLSAPKDFAESLAQGFHNVPKLYNDKTVRPQENVTGFQSGLKAASKDFSHGVYDGVTGVVTQPFNGAREGGVAGFVAGVGRGLGGLVLKPTGAVFSVPADAIKGVYKELQKTGDTRLEEHIQKSRMSQGGRESRSATEEEMAEIVKQWKEIKLTAGEPYLNRAQTLAQTLSWKLHGDKKEKRSDNGPGHGQNLRQVTRESGTGHLHGLWHLPRHHKKKSVDDVASLPVAVDTAVPSQKAQLSPFMAEKFSIANPASHNAESAKHHPETEPDPLAQPTTI